MRCLFLTTQQAKLCFLKKKIPLDRTSPDVIFQLKYNTCAFKAYAELAGKYRKSPRAENQDLETQSGKPIGELQLPGAFAHVGSPKAGDFTATRRSEDKALQGGKPKPRCPPEVKNYTATTCPGKGRRQENLNVLA